MRLVRCAAVAALAFGAVVATAVPAFAAPPGNDTYAGRTVVGSVPFSQTLDTNQATTDADDARLNTQCGAPRTDASVWYQVTAAASGGMAVDVSKSDYSAAAIVATGSPGSWTVLACAPGATSWPVAAGATYTILAFDDQLDGAGTGGTLRLTIDVAPPPTATIHATLDPFGQFNAPTGTATITGTATCTGTAESAFLLATLRQAVGHFTITGSGFVKVVCDEASHNWSMVVIPNNGKFAGGTAQATFTTICGRFRCGLDFEQHTVTLRRGP